MNSVNTIPYNASSTSDNSESPVSCESIKVVLDKACADFTMITNNQLGMIDYYNSAALGFAKVKEMAGKLEEIANENYSNLSGMSGGRKLRKNKTRKNKKSI
jgi:hypothetical protein